ncbi:MAG: 1,4-dihydroxy-2-naphthoate polyprenyltransferase [Actinobacteria bacterium]|nr:1,4-dihydroxy-2-naphthoate polyprenyltransferase [Actinomycetota bacterium]MCL5446171.1 1,4-dihydroxy-2-naphthoate polyprenyltransferase [Actinomycetota bacterium]
MPGMKSWIVGARPRTLVAAVMPVGTGASLVASNRAGSFGLAHGLDSGEWTRALLALAVAVGMQIGVNYANDYYDGVSGRDVGRVGPMRLTASGAVSARNVAIAAVLSFCFAGASGLALAAVLDRWWILIVGLVAAIAAIGYSGGPKPYASLGFGELFVFVFFGIVATVGSDYVISGGKPAWGESSVAAIPVGMLAVLILIANNLRDIAGDEQQGKRTLVVRIGRRRAGLLYVAGLLAAAVGVGALGIFRPPVLLALAAFPVSWKCMSLVLGQHDGIELLPVLGYTALLELLAGILIVVGLLI